MSDVDRVGGIPVVLKILLDAGYLHGDTLTVKKPTWQRMTQAQRAAKKAELGPEGFKIYKDSISTDATNRRVKSTGLSAEQLAANDLKLKEKMAKKKDAVDELNANQLKELDKAIEEADNKETISWGDFKKEMKEWKKK